MIRLIFTFLGIIVFQILYGQKEEVVSIHQLQTFRIASKGNLALGGNPTLVLNVPLPEGTVRWYYAFTAMSNPEQNTKTQMQIQLFAQLTRLFDETGTTANAIRLLSAPPGDAFCNVYHLSSQADANKFDQDFDFQSYYYTGNSSRSSFKSGVVEITAPSLCTGTQYIGIENPNTFYGLSCSIEVVAIVNKGWSGFQKQQLYDAFYTHFIENGITQTMSEMQAKQFVSCFVSKITDNYTPEQIASEASYKREEIVKMYAEICLKEQGLNINDIEKSYTGDNKAKKVLNPNYFIGTWKDENSIFTFRTDGTFYIKWDNQQYLWSSWTFENNLLYIGIGQNKALMAHSILSFTNDNFKYKAINDNTTYNAARVSH